MHSIFQKWDSYKLSTPEGIIFLKDSLPLTNHEEMIYNISISAMSELPKQFYWMDDITKVSGICVEEVIFDFIFLFFFFFIFLQFKFIS